MQIVERDVRHSIELSTDLKLVSITKQDMTTSVSEAFKDLNHWLDCLGEMLEKQVKKEA